MFDSAPYFPSEGIPEIPVILFSVKGAHSGPRLVVTGEPGAVRQAAERLWDLSGLIAMRGALELREGRVHDFGGYADDMLHLDAESPSAHLRVLGRMAALGMISGRGVPVRFIH